MTTRAAPAPAGTSIDQVGQGEIAHLLRRTGFSSTAAERRRGAELGYRATVEALLDPRPENIDDQFLLDRHLPAAAAAHEAAMAAPAWAWRLLQGRDALREKMALFWHGLFATAYKAGIYGTDHLAQIQMLRRHGLGRFEDLLVRLSQDPAMLVWLDNVASTGLAPNENYGRELLELFSLGVSNYSEADVRASARAFTGWTVRPAPPAFLVGPRPMQFQYVAEDHDDGQKAFLDASGPLNGHEIIAVIASSPAAALFIARKLYAFFVADDADQSAIAEVAAVFTETGGDMRSVMRHLLLADWFVDPAVRGRKVKSPVEFVFGLARATASDWDIPDHRVTDLLAACNLMGQTLLAPPNVGGWEFGASWLGGSNLLERINHASATVGALAGSPGLTDRDRLSDDPEGLVRACLSLVDLEDVSPASFDMLVESAQEVVADVPRPEQLVELLKLVVALPDFQYC